MTTLGSEPLSRSELYYADDHELTASGVFQFQDATYQVSFTHEDGLLRCLDTMMSFPDKPATPRLSLRPAGYRGPRPEWPVSALRFDYDPAHQVAAVVVLALDRNAASHVWMSRGPAGRADVVLTHDTWDAENKRFPPEAFISLPRLRTVIAQWAFGEVLPPPAISWTAVAHETVGWS